MINYQKQQKIKKEEHCDELYMMYKNNSKIKPPKNSLSELVYNNEFEELEKKLKNGNINPDSRDEIGITASWTPLYWSVKLRKKECAKVLLSYGADINLIVNDFEECCGTALDLAILRRDEEMEKLLREFAEKETTNSEISFKAIRTKLRGKAPSFYFNAYNMVKTKREKIFKTENIIIPG